MIVSEFFLPVKFAEVVQQALKPGVRLSDNVVRQLMYAVLLALQ